ncbi:GNAT family N-acetyltransferase [Nocardioides speluncae]|uniref:GNAT family N-acetyltransferase n=1 Tax=Nocardioides speluncae TaxID=2670337 RepID=UPI00137A0F29|nr:GNAT family N-acetyltransferase [Nocardioides speluncae]
MQSRAAEVRPAVDTDFPVIARMAAEDPGVVAHTAYTYWVLQAMAADAVLVVPDAGEGLAGYVVGVYPFQPEAALLLQIVVAPDRRRTGVGGALVTEFGRRAATRGCRRLLLTIDASNEVSEGFFHGFAEQRGWPLALAGSTGTLDGLLDPERIWELGLP